jgi:hypothetical protein
LEDVSVLRNIVAQPINFKKWAVFCLDSDKANGQYLQDKFYNLSQQRGLDIQVEFGDFICLRNHSTINDFKEAIDTYYHDYVAPDIAKWSKEKKAPGTPRDIYFFLVIIPFKAK